MLSFQATHAAMGSLDCLGASSDTDTWGSLEHHRVTGNDVYGCTGRSGARGDALANRDNQFAASRYYVAALADL